MVNYTRSLNTTNMYKLTCGVMIIKLYFVPKWKVCYLSPLLGLLSIETYELELKGVIFWS